MSQNVRGLGVRGRWEGDVPEKVVKLVRHMERGRIQVACLQETWIEGQGEVEFEGYTIMFAGGKRTHNLGRVSGGLAIVLSPLARERWDGVVMVFSKRVMGVRLEVSDTDGSMVSLFIGNSYAPVRGLHTAAEFDSYWAAVDDMRTACKSNEIMAWGGDFNASLGSRTSVTSRDCAESKKIVGAYAVGYRNKTGEDLLNYLCTHDIRAATTYFKHQQGYATWYSSVSKRSPQLDHWMVKSTQFARVQDAKRCHSVAIRSDHAPVVLTLRIAVFLAKSKRQKGVKTFKVNREALQSVEGAREYGSDVLQEFRQLNGSSRIGAEGFANLQAAAQAAAKKLSRGIKKRPSPPWYRAREEKLDSAVAKRNDEQRVYDRKLDAGDTTADKTRLTKARNALARAINDAKNTWLCAHAESMNNCIKTNPTVFWSAAKQLVAGLGKAEAPKVMSLKDGEGNKAKTDAENGDILRPHLTTLYNVHANSLRYDPSVLDSLPQGDLMAELDDPPTLKEAESALKAMHNGKAAGLNGLPIEVYKVIWFSSEEGAKVLLEILSVFWESETVPVEWIKAKLCLLPKKGDLSDPNNWRGIMLLDCFAKWVGSILGNRLKAVFEKIGFSWPLTTI